MKSTQSLPTLKGSDAARSVPGYDLATVLRKSQLSSKVSHMETPQDRVRDVIERSGLGQGGFAKAIGLDDSKMSKSLSGARRFSSLEFASIADVGAVSVDWLLNGQSAPLAMAARAASGTSTGSAVELATSIVELRETAQALGYPQSPVLVETEDLRGLAYRQGDLLAIRALEVCRRHGVSPMAGDLAESIEAGFGVDVAVRDMGDGFDGLAASTPDASIIIVSPSARPGRQRFTMAHELGHLLGGDDQGVHPDVDVYQADTARDPTEMRASAFAASFLMPEEFLRQHVVRGFDEQKFCHLAVELVVSPSALAHRLKNLKLIDAMAAEQFGDRSLLDAARLSEGAERIAVATTRAQLERPPGLLSRDLFKAYVDGKTTLRPYAQLIGTDTAALRAQLDLGKPGA